MIASNPRRSSLPGASAHIAMQSAARPKRTRSSARALLLGLGTLSLVSVALSGCGAPAEGDGGYQVPSFGNSAVSPLNPNQPNGATGAGAGGSAATACVPGTANCSTLPPQTSENPNPNTPIVNTPPPMQLAPVAQACTPNQVVCAGNLLNTCNAAGTQISPLDCASNGGSCGTVAGAPGCVAPPPPPPPSCTPGLSCAGANTISTCAADGSTSLSRCPDGTNCTGAGQCTPVQCNTTGMLSSNNGGVTVYWFAQGTISSPRAEGQDVHCGFNGTRANNDDMGQQDRVAYIQDPAFFGAMNLGQYNGAASCGACVELTRNGGSPTTITVADSCNPAINNNGTCTTGHIDLSRAAFQQLTGANTGDINGVNWRFVPCDGVDNVQFLLKKPDDQYWNQFLVVNHRYPIAKAEVHMGGGRWVEARRELYNYWLPPEGDGGTGGDMGTYLVRVTDINGGIIEEQLELRGGLQGGSGQFDCQ